MKIIMYTKDKCPNCERAKFMLNYSPVPVDLEIRNIESGRDAEKNYEFLTKTMRSNTVPSFLIPDAHGSYHVEDGVYEGYHGFDENLGRLQEVLGL